MNKLKTVKIAIIVLTLPYLIWASISVPWICGTVCPDPLHPWLIPGAYISIAFSWAVLIVSFTDLNKKWVTILSILFLCGFASAFSALYLQTSADKQARRIEESIKIEFTDYKIKRSQDQGKIEKITLTGQIWTEGFAPVDIVASRGKYQEEIIGSLRMQLMGVEEDEYPKSRDAIYTRELEPIHLAQNNTPTPIILDFPVDNTEFNRVQCQSSSSETYSVDGVDGHIQIHKPDAKPWLQNFDFFIQEKISIPVELQNTKFLCSELQ